VRLRFLTLFAAQGLDFATFNTMVATQGPSSEANPLVHGMLVALGTPAVAFVKVALIGLVIALGVAAAARGKQGIIWSAVGGLPLALAIAAGIIGGITNAATILH
jgi:hypothetical protein